MNENTVIFRNGRAFLERRYSIPCLFIRDVTKHLPIHEMEKYKHEDLSNAVKKAIEETGSYASHKYATKSVVRELKNLSEEKISLEEFLNEDIGNKAVTELKELDSLLTVLNTHVILEEGTLFKHLWNYIEKDYETFNVLFTDTLGGYDLQKWIDCAKVPYEKSTYDLEKEKTGIGMHKLQCYWNTSVEQDSHSIFDGEFGGHGTHKREIWENGEKTGEVVEDCDYGVSFSPINALLDYPLELLEEFKIDHLNIYKKRKFSYPKIKPAINTKRDWKVYDVIQAILWEISFMGSPEEQDKKSDEIKEQIEGIDNGTIETTSWEELRKDLDEMFEEEKEKEDEDEMP